MGKPTTLKQKLLLVFFGLFLSVIFLEMSLRFAGFIYLSVQKHKNEIDLDRKDVYRILCVGESTTASQYPDYLQNILNQKSPKSTFKVIDCGVPGTTSSSILIILEDNITKYSPHMIITMMGINDVIFKLNKYDGPTIASLLKKFRIFKLVRLLKMRIVAKNQETQKNRNTAHLPISNTMPHQPKDYMDYISRGDYYFNVLNLTAAEPMFKKALELSPRNDLLYAKLGIVYQWTNRLSESEDAYKMALKINPKHLGAYAGLALVYNMRGKNSDEAGYMFKKALEIEPNAAWLYRIARLHYSTYIPPKRMLKETVPFLIKAIEKFPEEEWYYAALVNCYKKLGDHENSKKYEDKLANIRREYFNPVTYINYNRLAKVVLQKGIRLVCMQYPVRSTIPLKEMLKDYEDSIIFVDNQKIFEDAIERSNYNEYFTDNFGGDFGHCTIKGNTLLAEHLANIILKELEACPSNGSRRVSSVGRPDARRGDEGDVLPIVKEAATPQQAARRRNPPGRRRLRRGSAMLQP